MSYSFGKFKIYPRGFLGAVLDPVLLKQGGYSPKTQRLQYDVTLFDPKEERSVTANLAIEDIYAKLVRNDVKADDFDFREEALIKILQAFGTQNFTEWYIAQFQSPSFGILQHRFLDDVLRFVRTGRSQMSLQNWDEIVLATQDRETFVDGTLSEEATWTFRGAKSMAELHKSSRMSVPDMVQEWMRKPGGFSHLVHTSHILFGIK